MKKSFVGIIAGCAFVLLVLLPAALAQTVTGAITGEVSDPSGAVIPGAKVTAHAVSTGVDTSTTTNSAGHYRIEFLPIGPYTVTVQATGFGTTSVPEFALEVQQT